jgi:hypothetical protein
VEESDEDEVEIRSTLRKVGSSLRKAFVRDSDDDNQQEKDNEGGDDEDDENRDEFDTREEGEDRDDQVRNLTRTFTSSSINDND